MPKKERTRTNKTYSPEFKTTVVEDLLTNKLSYKYTVNKYGLMYGKSDGGARAMVQRWERIYLQEGVAGFMVERRGRKSKGRPRKIPLLPTVTDDLIGENQKLKERLEYLEAENEYLKKLDALVRE